MLNDKHFYEVFADRKNNTVELYFANRKEVTEDNNLPNDAEIHITMGMDTAKSLLQSLFTALDILDPS